MNDLDLATYPLIHTPAARCLWIDLPLEVAAARIKVN
jgi:hypothetical protein